MADKKISALPELTTPVAGDLIPVVDISEPADADKNKYIDWGTFSTTFAAASHTHVHSAVVNAEYDESTHNLVVGEWYHANPDTYQEFFLPTLSGTSPADPPIIITIPYSGGYNFTELTPNGTDEIRIRDTLQGAGTSWWVSSDYGNILAIASVSAISGEWDLAVIETDNIVYNSDSDQQFSNGSVRVNDLIAARGSSSYLSINALGASLSLYGAVHATKARDFEFDADGVELHYDHSASTWNFQANNITTTGSITGVNVTSGSNPGHTHTAYEPVMTAASQAEMEAGTETALRSMTPQRVAQAIAALASGGIAWNYRTTSLNPLVVNTAYVFNGASLTGTLPSTCAVGDEIIAANRHSSDLTIADNGTTIEYQGTSYTSDVTLAQGETIHLICVVVNSTWLIV